MKRAKTLVWLLATAITLTAVRAQAYVPPAEYILRKYIHMRTGVEAIWVKSKVSAVVDGETTGIHFFDVTTYDPSSQLVQSLAFDEDNKLLFVKTVKAGEAATATAPGMALASYLMFVDKESYLFQNMEAWGVPVHQEADVADTDFSREIQNAKAQTAEGQEFDPRPLLELLPKSEASDATIRRWKDGLSWVVGKPDTKTSKGNRQIWIEKDSFLPQRIVFSEGRELQFEKFRFMKNYPYPAEIRILDDNNPVLLSELNKVIVNPSLKDFPKKAIEGYTDEGGGVSGRLKTLIDRFYAEIR